MRPTDEALVSAARQAKEKAYAPYSHFSVGAAVDGDDGKVYTGCNVENGSYGLTSCAERNAVFAAVAAGCRKIYSVAVVPMRTIRCLAVLAVRSWQSFQRNVLF